MSRRLGALFVGCRGVTPRTDAGRRLALLLANRDNGGVPTDALLDYWGERILEVEFQAAALSGLDIVVSGEEFDVMAEGPAR